MYSCVWVCVYMYMYVCIYVCIYTHTHNQPKSEKRNRDLIPFLCLFLSDMRCFSYGWLLHGNFRHLMFSIVNCLNGNVRFISD